MSERAFIGEFTHLIFIAVALSLFFVFFVTYGRIALSKIGNPGLQEAFAAA